jgi:hypothetical protein
VVAADFCNATAATLDFRQWTFINADLSVHFAPQPAGAWILLDGESRIVPMERAWPSHGWRTRAVISAAPSRASSSRSDEGRNFRGAKKGGVAARKFSG